MASISRIDDVGGETQIPRHVHARGERPQMNFVTTGGQLQH